YFLRLEHEKYEREYKSIRQLNGETSIEFMTRFVRLAGFLGAKGGTPEEQARKFKWALYDIARDKLVNMEFLDVAKVANAARNIKILQKEMLALTQNDNKKRT
nr:zinc finger, CCHC-type, retrotransposon Gag domain protein [Tanacetum cinerariifolium]